MRQLQVDGVDVGVQRDLSWFEYMNDFIGSTAATCNVTTTFAGGSLALANLSGVSHPGSARLFTGATTTGAAAMSIGAINATAIAAPFVMEWMVRTGGNISDGTDTYTLVVGLVDSQTSAAFADGLAFVYTHSLNGGRWVFRRTIGSTPTDVDTGVTFAANTWYKMRFDIAVGDASVVAYINGVVVATISSGGMPTSTALEPTVLIIKSAGVNTRFVDADYLYIRTRYNR